MNSNIQTSFVKNQNTLMRIFWETPEDGKDEFFIRLDSSSISRAGFFSSS